MLTERLSGRPVADPVGVEPEDLLDAFEDGDAGGEAAATTVDDRTRGPVDGTDDAS